MGWTKGTVSGRLARAKDLLRGRLVRRGLAPSAGILAVSLTPQTASAALPESLLAATVRAATAASLGVAETTLVSGRVAALVRESLKVMSLWQLGRAAAQILAFGLGTAAIATPMSSAGTRRANANAGAGPLDGHGTSPRISRAPSARASRLRPIRRPFACLAYDSAWGQRNGDIQPRSSESTSRADGKAVVSARADGIVHFWDPVSGRTVETIDLMGDARTPDQAIRNFTISADGRFMAALSTSQDPATHSLVRSIWIRSLPDGRAGTDDRGEHADVDSLAISPDGATLASGATNGEVQLWDVATRCFVVRHLNWIFASVPLLAFAPDGKTLAISALGSKITLWDLERDRGTPLADLTSGPFAPCFSRDGRLLAVNTIDGQVVIVNRATGLRQLTRKGIAYAFAPDGRSLAMIGVGGALQVIDTSTGSSSLGERPRVRSGDNGRGLLARRRNDRHVHEAACSGSLKPSPVKSGSPTPRRIKAA